MALFLCPKGHWLIRAMRGTGKAAPVALHGEGGYSLSRKRVSPFATPERKDEGSCPSTPHIGRSALEELRGLRNRVRCTWLRHESLRFVADINRALLREARVTVARRRTACGRHCFARRRWDCCFSISTVFFSVNGPQLIEIRTGQLRDLA